MPAALVKSLADKAGIDAAEAERRWKKAKAIAEQETGMAEGDGDDFWEYVAGVFKKSMGISAIMEAAKGQSLVGKGYVFHNTTKAALKSIMHEGMDSGSFARTPIDFGGDIWIAVKETDLPKSDEHQYGNARALEPAWEIKDWGEAGKRILSRYVIPPSKIVLVNKKGVTVASILESATAEEIHAAAHEAATSHLNDTPEPTEAQKQAGRYKMGHIRLYGMEITIENPAGSARSGVDPNGKAWSVTMPAHYGYVKGTEGADGDHVDLYIGEHPESELAFIVDQLDADTGKFDEHKCIVGCQSQKEARDLYIAGFSDGKGAKRLGAMTAMHMPAFKEWLFDGDTSKPMSEVVMEAAEDSGRYFTEAELLAAAKDSPDLWRLKIKQAVVFEDIQAAFALKWPGIIGLTNKSEGDTSKASTDKEGAMTYGVEVSRQNVTVAEFFKAIKTACEKKGIAFDLEQEVFENPSRPSNDTYFVKDGIKYARYGDGEPTREYDGTDAPAKSETSRMKPYDYQTHILNFDGSMFNEICEFTFDDGKHGHGYYYQASRDAAAATVPAKTEPLQATNPQRDNEVRTTTRVYFTTQSGGLFVAHYQPINPKTGKEWQASRKIKGADAYQLSKNDPYETSDVIIGSLPEDWNKGKWSMSRIGFSAEKLAIAAIQKDIAAE